MSVQALSAAFAVRGVSPSEKLTLLALCNFANERMECWPSQERLAEDTELGERTIWAALKSLEAKGLITRTRRTRVDGSRASDMITLNLEILPAKSAKPTRKSGEACSQDMQGLVAPVATLTTFEPSTEPSTKQDANASCVASGDATKAFQEWNDLARRLTLPTAKDLTPARRKAINARLATAGLDGWREALAAVEASPHCRGENDRGWRADLDFVASAAKFQKLREGSYGPPPAASGAPAKAATFDDPRVRASIVKAQDEDFARRWIDHYCRWEPDGRRLIARTSSVASRLQRDLAEWASANRVTIEVATANDEAEPQRERVA
jgi:hypothetical protein